MAHFTTQSVWIASKIENRELMIVWPNIIRDIMNEYLDFPEVIKWLTKMLQYNVSGGKKNRASTLIYAYKMLAPRDHITQDNIRLMRILAWCVEMLHAFFVVIDDIQDGSTLRRNQQCWYLHSNTGLSAINDAMLIENMIYQLIQKNFKGKDCYTDLLETFQNIALKTMMGQFLDLQSTNFGKTPNLNLFTMNRYNSITKHKTAYYTFVLPVTIAMHFAGIKNQEMLKEAQTILLKMGQYFQVQDDYLDCYEIPEVTGKFGTDIQEGKCTWLVVTALQRATSEQRKILEECYGSKDEEKVRHIKQLYNDLNLSSIYSKYEEEMYNLLNTHMQQMSCEFPEGFFQQLLEKIYHRMS